MSLIRNIKKEENDINVDVNFLQTIIGNDLDYLESKEKLEEIHSRAWSIQLKAERMLRFNNGTVEIKK